MRLWDGRHSFQRSLCLSRMCSMHVLRIPRCMPLRERRVLRDTAYITVDAGLRSQCLRLRDGPEWFHRSCSFRAHASHIPWISQSIPLEEIPLTLMIHTRCNKRQLAPCWVSWFVWRSRCTSCTNTWLSAIMASSKVFLHSFAKLLRNRPFSLPALLGRMFAVSTRRRPRHSVSGPCREGVVPEVGENRIVTRSVAHLPANPGSLAVGQEASNSSEGIAFEQDPVLRARLPKLRREIEERSRRVARAI